MIFMFLTPKQMEDIIEDYDNDFGDHSTTSF
jgi:hypothetical protein